jgi:hypothetical protein
MCCARGVMYIYLRRCEVWAFRAFGAPLPVGARRFGMAFFAMLRHIACVRKSVPTHVLLEDLHMHVPSWPQLLLINPHEDTGVRRIVHFWYLHPIDFGAITSLLRSWVTSLWRGLSCSSLVLPIGLMPIGILTIAGFGALPISPGRPRCFCLRPSSFVGLFWLRMVVHTLPIDVGRRHGPPFSVTVICVVQLLGPLAITVGDHDERPFIFMCPALAPGRARFCPLFASRDLAPLPLWVPDHSICSFDSTPSVHASCAVVRFACILRSCPLCS